MIVINARVFSSKHVMIGERETSEYPYMVFIIWNVEGIPLYCCVAIDMAPRRECYFVSWYTRGKSGGVPNNIPNIGVAVSLLVDQRGYHKC